ncbi:MAG: hypothetical protein ABJA50_06600 [Chloroflexota bacterium]
MHKYSAFRTNRSFAFWVGLGMAGILIIVLLIFLISTRLLGTPSQSASGRSGQAVAQEQVSPSATAAPPIDEVITQITARNFGTWEYSTTSSNFAGIHSTVNYNHSSVSDIQSYVAVNQALLPQVAAFGGQVQITLTFLPPLAPDVFRDWAREHALTVTQAQIAVGAPGGTSGTIMVNGTADDPLPQPAIESVPFAGMGGVFGVYGTVDSSNLTAMASDPKVYLVDVTPAWVQHDLLVSGYTEAARSEVYLALPYGWMENLGMVPTPQPVPNPVRTISPVTGPAAPDDTR